MSTLIGRDHELRTLEQALKLAEGGNASCLLLTGEPGIGKSRLIDEVKRQAASHQFTILQGNCFEQDLSFPYAAWIDALRGFFVSRDADEIRGLLGPLAPEFVKLLPELALLLPGLQASPPLESPAEKHRLFESIARFGASLAASHPLLLILEDLHWGDTLSLELIEYFVRRMQPRAVLCLGTGRPDDPSPQLLHLLSQLSRERLSQEIALKPFGRDQVEQMARSFLTSPHRIPAPFVDALLAHTDGNPLFLEETLKSLSGQRPLDAVLQSAGPQALPVPPTIQRLEQERAQPLPRGTRQILDLASVLGQRFDFGLLQELSGRTEPELIQALRDLVAAHLLVQESPGQFAFRHALTQQAVYSMLALPERNATHRLIGETLERLAGPRVEASAPQLAYHFYQAEAWPKAMEYSQRAGDLAHQLYAPREALAHFTHALDSAQHLGLPTPLAALRGRAQAYEIWGEFDLARLDYETALGLARQSADPRAEWQALIDLGLLWQSRDFQRAGEYFQQGLERARNLEDPASLAVSLNRIGNWYVNQGRPREALPLHRQALDLFGNLNDRRGLAVTMDLLGILSYGLGEVLQGAQYLSQAVSIQRDLDDRQGLVNSLTNLTLQARQETEVLGDIDYRKLSALSDEALQIAQGFNWYHGQTLALIQGAICLGKAGEYGSALERIDRAQSIVEASANRESFARLHFTHAALLADLLALPEARQHFETGLAVVTELGSTILARTATAQLASVVILERDLVRAHVLLDSLTPSNFPQGELLAAQRFCWAARAELYLAEGQPDRALEIIDGLIASTANLARYGSHSVPRLSRLRASALSALKRPLDAEDELQGAIEVAGSRRQLPLLWRLHADLGALYRTLRRREATDREFAAAAGLIQELARKIPEDTLRDNFLVQAMGVIPATRPPTSRQAAKQQFSGLTSREREIAAQIARGRSNREIANELVISETTAERHVANILLKLGFNSRTQIAVWAAERGLHK